jgi:hypothetical protein
MLDGDELLAEPPGPVIESAEAEGADLIWAWQAHFYFTDRDLADWKAGRDDRGRPITARRRYYAINWQEPRLFRNRPDVAWDGATHPKLPPGLGRRARRLIMNRHYQFRDPPQMVPAWPGTTETRACPARDFDRLAGLPAPGRDTR